MEMGKWRRLGDWVERVDEGQAMESLEQAKNEGKVEAEGKEWKIGRRKGESLLKSCKKGRNLDFC